MSLLIDGRETWGPIAMNVKDWTTIIISLLALVVAAGTAFYSAILRSDDIRVIPSATPSISIDDKGVLGCGVSSG
jgi:hypothetical protein